MKDETKRARVRARRVSRETEGKERRGSIPFGEKRKDGEKNFPWLGCYPIREGEDSSWRRRGLWWGLVLLSKNKISLPKRTFAVSHLRVGDGGSLLLLGDNLGDDLGAGDLGL
jgi:hypothetical protein